MMHGARDHLGACARLDERKGHQRRGLPAYQNGGVKAQQALHYTAARDRAAASRCRTTAQPHVQANSPVSMCQPMCFRCHRARCCAHEGCPAEQQAAAIAAVVSGDAAARCGPAAEEAVQRHQAVAARRVLHGGHAPVAQHAAVMCNAQDIGHVHPKRPAGTCTTCRLHRTPEY